MIRPLALACLVAVSLPLSAEPLGTAFTYQGHLADGGQPATDLYDFEFCLFDSLTGGASLGCTPLAQTADLPVDAGIFTASLDFGSAAFAGEKRFLEIRVRSGSSSGPFDTLVPRQLISAAPEALRARSAPWAGISGIPAGFQDGSDNEGITSVIAGAGLSGGGAAATATLAVDDALVQARIGSSCAAGSSIRQILQSGNVVCESDDAGTGTVTSVAAGTGLVATGGTPITGSGSLSIANNGVGAAQVDPGQVQLRVSDSCPEGSYLRGIGADGTPECDVLSISSSPLESVLDAQAATHVSVAIGLDGMPVISYRAGGDLRFAKCVDRACAGPAVFRTIDGSPGNQGDYSSIAVRSDGRPVVAYFDAPSAAVAVVVCGSPDCASVASVAYVQTGLVTGAAGLSLGLRAGDLPSVAFVTTANQLRLHNCASADCAGVVPTSTLVTGAPLYPALAIGQDGQPLVSYFDSTNSDLRVAKCAGPLCSTPSDVVVDSDNAGADSSLAFDSTGAPVVSYRAGSAIKLARCPSLDCTTGTPQIGVVDAAVGPAFTRTSVAVPTTGNPIVAYRNSTTGKALVAKCLSPGCDGPVARAVLNGAASADGYVDLALDAEGLPFIAHTVTAPTASVRVAKCRSSLCQ